MQYIDFNVQHQTITRTDNYEVVGNSENYLYARFEFCAEWADIIPTAVFSANNGTHIAVEIENGECLVPWEMLRVPEFWVGVFGGDRQTTDTARVGVKPGVKLNASPGVQPTPTAYEQLMSELREGMAQVEEHAENVVNAVAQTEESVAAAESFAATADSAKDVVLEALNNVPAGSTVVVNNLTTGGTSAALSAEMGKLLEQSKVPVVTVNYSSEAMSADNLVVPLALIKLNSSLNAELWEVFGKVETYAYVRTMFFYKAATNQSHAQIAYSYNASPAKMAIRTYNANTNTWTPWNAPLTGAGGNMAAGARFRFSQNGGGVSSIKMDGNNFVISTSLSSENENVNYATFNFKNNGDMLIGAVGEAGSAAKWINVLTTANKPSGSYTGNGDATERRIATGGIGSVVAVWGGSQVSFITANGGINCNQSTTSPIPIAQAWFANGTLVMKTTLSSVNANSITYTYQVL